MAIDRERREEDGCPEMTFRPRKKSRGLSFGQQRLLFLDQLNPSSGEYLVSRCFRLRGPVEVAAVRQGLLTVVGRHEILRCTFAFDQRGEPVVSVGAEADAFTFEHVDWSGYDLAAREDLLRPHLTDPMDLTTGPLLRVVLARIEQDDHLLLFVVHHIVIDEWSWEVFAGEFSEAYRAHLDRRNPVLRQLPMQYREYAERQRREMATDPEVGIELEYWRGQLADMNNLALPTDFPRPARRSGLGASHSFALPAELAGKIVGVFAAHRVSHFMGYLAIFKVLLAKYSNSLDIAVGTPISTRSDTELESLIGFFLNTLVIRTQLEPDLTVRDLFARVRDQSLSAYDHSTVPFEMLVETLSPERNLSRSPLFQALFVHERETTHHWQLPHLHTQHHDLPSFTCWSDVALTISASDGATVCTLEYTTDVFAADTAKRMARHFYNLVASVSTANSDTLIRDLSMLDLDDQQEILRRGRGLRVAIGEKQTILQQFEGRVRECPHAVALRIDQSQVTRADLDAWSRALATRLLTRGLAKGATVGLCLARSADLVVAMLAVMRAGGSYVPLDPSFPQQRIQLLLNDCAAAIVITDDAGASALPRDANLTQINVRDALGESAEPDIDLPVVQPSDLAYLMYTSGSTGMPKGVQIEHHALVNVSDHFAQLAEVDATTTVLALTAVTFDIAALELLMPLAQGAVIALCPDGASTDPHQLAELLTTMRPTVI
ncbi:MAG: non-ribosomal peptide synthetase, partial [Pseudonocardiaceae bacterium]